MPLLEQACGIGVDVSREEIYEAVCKVIEEHREELLSERYSYPIHKLLYSFKQGRMKWADGKTVKSIFDEEIKSLLGEKTERDKVVSFPLSLKDSSQEVEVLFRSRRVHRSVTLSFPFSPAATWNPPKTPPKTSPLTASAPTACSAVAFPPSRTVISTSATRRVSSSTSTAPSPAPRRNAPPSLPSRPGETLLRFDDTNPETEQSEFIAGIQEDVAWLGWRPSRVTFSSDYFERLFGCALQLIRQGNAYVDHQTPAEIRQSREVAMKLSKGIDVGGGNRGDFRRRESSGVTVAKSQH